LFFAIALFVSISAVSASLRPQRRRRAAIGSKQAGVYWTQLDQRRLILESGRLHKAVVSSANPDALAQAKSSGAIEIADYGSFKLLAMDESAACERRGKAG